MRNESLTLPKVVTCPECGATHDMARNFDPEDDDPPVCGDLVICFDCQTVNMYTEGLELRSLNEEELMEMSLVDLAQYQKMINNAKAAMLEDENE